jgi:endoglucanase
MAMLAAGFGPSPSGLAPDAPEGEVSLASLGNAGLAPMARWHPNLPRPAITADDRAEWQIFKQRFLAPEGRVVDTGNHNNSHSEGQGWGLLFAEAFDDQAAFDLILDWTATNLRRNGDALHAWRYKPDQPNHVDDYNNATDGDLFIAAALARAALRWGRPDLAQASGAIARDVLALLVREVDGRMLLLPAELGFEKREGVIVNPSYYAFGMLPYLEAMAPSPAWQRLRADGLSVIQQGRFGPWGLPPDWLLVPRRGGMLAPAPSWPARFSYDAIRVPLHLAWSGLLTPEMHRAFQSYWVATGAATPAWIDLKTGAMAPYQAPAGMVAVSKLLTSQQDLALPFGLPSVRTATDYYSAALIVLSRLAWKESRVA